jgi:hypothetical protein
MRASIVRNAYVEVITANLLLMNANRCPPEFSNDIHISGTLKDSIVLQMCARSNKKVVCTISFPAFHTADGSLTRRSRTSLIANVSTVELVVLKIGTKKSYSW